MKTAIIRWATGVQFAGRRSIAALLLILLTGGLLSALHSFAKPLWYDEILTVLVCRLPGPSAIWKALDDAVDGAPPGYYLTVRLGRQLIPEDHLGYRLPSILGLLGTVLFIYFILSRRVDSLAALVGAASIMCLVAYYGSEARPYALMVACISGAIFAWQRIDDSKLYSLFLAMSLAAALSVHYYSIFVWPAFVLAEATVWLIERRFRVAAWAALVVATVPLLLFAPLLVRLREYYGQNFWAKPRFSDILLAHGLLFHVRNVFALTFVAGATAILAYWSLSKMPWLRRQTAGASGIPAQECVLILMLLWLPAIAIPAAIVSHGGMTPRYMMPTLLGAAMAIGYLASKLPPSWKGLLLILLLTRYGFAFLPDVREAMKGSLLHYRVAAIDEAKAISDEQPDPDLPIVISSGHQYLEMAYYAPADPNRKPYAVTDPSAAVKYAGSDSVDLNLLALRRHSPIQVEDYAGFASRHKEFLLVSNGDNPWDWWPARFAHDGTALSLLSIAGDMRVYKVTLQH